MSRQRTRKTAVGIQLFPFLAVLICTMGALIVMLVLVVSQARVHADAIAEDRVQQQRTQAAEESQLREAREDIEWRQQVLAQQRQELQQRLADQRLELSHLEEHIRRLEQKLQQLSLQADQWKRLGTGRQQDRVTTQDALARLQTEIEQERQRLEEARQQASQQRRSFAIILYRGLHGTQRRPIYLECTATGIIIRPEGITLTPEDLDGPLGPGNPLDAALRAIREHWARTETKARGEEPYPLLIVRPDGAVAYSVARAAMSSWEDEFGYELVDADMELAFPPGDPTLKQVVEASIRTARQRQAILVAAMPSRFERSAVPRESTGDESGAWEPLLGANTGRSRTAVAQGGPGNMGGLANLAQGYGISPKAVSSVGGGSPGPTATSGSPGAISQAHQMSRAGYTTTEGLLVATANGDTGSSGGLGGGTGVRGSRAGDPGGSSPGGSSPGGGSPGGSSPGGSSPGGGSPGGSSPGGSSSGGSSPGGSSSGGSSSGGSSSGGSSPGGSSSGGSSSGGGFDAAGVGGTRSTDGSPENGRDGKPGSFDSRRRGSSSSGEDGGDGAKNNSPGQLRGGAKSSTKTFDVGPSVSQRKPLDATGITRPIFVECHPDRLVILPDQGTDGKPQVVPIQATMRSTVGAFATVLRTHMDRWGLAVAGGYWKPVLRVKVMPGAEAQFEQLKSLLESHGIDVQKKEEPRRYRPGGVSLPS